MAEIFFDSMPLFDIKKGGNLKEATKSIVVSFHRLIGTAT